MGLFDGAKRWFARRKMAQALAEADKWANREGAEAEKERREQGMSKLGPFVKGVGVAFVTGLITALVDAVQNGGFEFSKDGLYKGLSAAIAAGLIAAGAYLKASPLKPKDEAPKA